MAHVHAKLGSRVAQFALRAGATVLLVAACGDTNGGTEGAAGSAAPIAGASAGAGGHAGMTAMPRDSACQEPFAPRTPRSVADVVEMLNAMPKPVTLPCFLESLERPFSLQATTSVLSAQPAVGKRSPRMFLFFDPLVASVVPDGTGRHLLELGERRSETHSLKAELEFPITEEVAPEAPFARLRYDDRLSTCDFCHANSEPAEEPVFPYAFVSQALKPVLRERVKVEALMAEARACDKAVEAERCEMLNVLFREDDPPSEAEFPATYRTFVP
jgi:hypothetical protein